MVSPVLASSVVSAVLSGIISYVVSSRIAEKQARAQIELENQQRLQEWYERAVALAQRTSDDWWDVMTSGEKGYDIDAKTKFLDRRDELREHAARGQGLGVDDDVVRDLQQAARCLGHAAGELDSGKELATIEKETLIPTLDSIEETCEGKDFLSTED